MTVQWNTGMVAMMTLALLSGAGCAPDPHHPSEFGLASIESANVQIIHRGDLMDVRLTADLTAVDDSACPPLAGDLTVTVNGQPLKLSLSDVSDAFTFTCSVRSLEGSITLNSTTGSLHLAFAQGSRTALLEVSDTSWPTFGPVTISAAVVPLGGPFSIDVGVSPAAAPYVRRDCWLVWTCPAASPGCIVGDGWSGFTIEQARLVDGKVRLSTQVPDVTAPHITIGDRLLTVEQPPFCFLTSPVSRCDGLPSCNASMMTDSSMVFGPFPLTVTE